jgi:uncharacterized membrane protein YeiH
LDSPQAGCAVIDLDPSSEPLRSLVLTLDLCGTFAFALLGAMAAVRRQLDVFGVLVVSFVAASFGGIARDLLIGAVPPAALMDWRYLAVSLAAGMIVFFWGARIDRLFNPVLVLDAAGLAFFCVAGAQKALAFGLSPLMAALLGMLTGIGGGIVRDILLTEVPTVLRRTEIYAVAALAGALVVVAGEHFQFPPIIAAISGGLACFSLRILAIRYGWRLPVARGQEP